MKSPLTNTIDFRGLVILFALVLSLFSYQSAFANKPTESASIVNFFDGDFDAAKNKASQEGKLFFLEFHADWCMPCKWMDQTTFTDARVATIMNDSYVAIKVDIDKVEGFEMKNKFDIQYLPTMLIFNSQGILIDRIEETLPAKRLANILSTHDKEGNKVVNNTANKSPINNSNIQPDKMEEYANNKELMDGYSKFNDKHTFRLQMGVYDSYENAFNEVNALKEAFIEPIIVINDFNNDGVRYKIMMGEFTTMKEAEGFRKILKRDFSKDAIVQ